MDFEKATIQQGEMYLGKLILGILQQYGGRAERSEIRERLLDENEDVAHFAQVIKTSKTSGKDWHPFDYRFNFAIKNLMIAEFLVYSRNNPIITLTEKGMSVDLDIFDPNEEIWPIAKEYWDNKHQESKRRRDDGEEGEKSDVDEMSEYEEDFKTKLLEAISKMSPKKFELFSRALLSKMGVEFTQIGTQISNDGGIDGYGYCRTDDFRTSRVVIQCKRWQGNVGSVEIDQFLGAMNKHQADYGIFITNSRYTQSAREAARAGTPITLIDGDELVRLVKKYQLYIIPVTTYILDDFYETE